MFIVGEYQREIIFEDQGLETAIRKNLKKNTGKISNGDVFQITHLDASSKNIRSLKGIENLHRLVELDLDNNFIKDVTLLSQLKKLKVLKLRNNKITSLKSINFQMILANKLRELCLCHNVLQSENNQAEIYLTDISILSHFSNLEILKLRDNHIEDISSLTDLVNLKELDLRGNRISDISPLKKLLNLEALNLRENLIKDISPLVNLKKLKYLNIHSNSLIKVFYALERLDELETLIMQNIPIGKNIIVIRNMPKLKRLNIRNCVIEDISPLVELMSKEILQDKEDEKATVDIRDNNLIIDDADMYFRIQQMWKNVTYRFPIIFPAPNNVTPDFSHKAGFYREAFELKLFHSDPEAMIYYTFDGSIPNPNNVLTDLEYNSLPVENRFRTFLYTNPIEISKYMDWNNDITKIRTCPVEVWIEPKTAVKKAVVIRAIAKSKGMLSKENVATYFIDQKRNKKYNLPVVSIATDRNNLFNYFNGIYVPGINYINGKVKTGNYFENGNIWKKPAYFEYFDKNGVISLSQNVTIQIHGVYSCFFPLKTLRVNAESNYFGTDKFNYPFYNTKANDKFHNILLRNSGNDYRGVLFRDAATQTLIQHLTLDTQHYQPSIVFINGEYWGIHNLRDCYDEHYIENHYKIPKNEVVILERSASDKDNDTPLIRKYKKQYKDMVDNILRGKLNTWEKIDRYMTVSEYLDYNIIEMYSGNADWPHNNIQFWRYTGNNTSEIHGPFDGRWRWMVFDIDPGFTTKDFNMVEFLLQVKKEHPWARELIHGLLTIKDIRYEFIQRTAIHLNTTFRPGHVKDHVSKLASAIESEIPEHSARWGQPAVEAWYNEVNLMKNFAEQRPFYFRKHMDNFFDEIKGTANLTISNIDSKADIKLHTVLLKDNTPGVLLENKTWNGLMFTGEAPIKLYSSNVNLNLALIEGSYQIIERTKNSLVFNIYGDVRIKIK